MSFTSIPSKGWATIHHGRFKCPSARGGNRDSRSSINQTTLKALFTFRSYKLLHFRAGSTISDNLFTYDEPSPTGAVTTVMKGLSPESGFSFNIQ